MLTRTNSAPKVYMYQRSDDQLIRWHTQATILWTAEDNAPGESKAFRLMNATGLELEARGYKAHFASIHSPLCTWIK